jgi:predicted alpha-1,2-mannosidase
MTGFIYRAQMILVLASILPFAPSTRADPDLLQWVDPFIGTAETESPETAAAFKAGNVNPGASLPWGMVQFSPDTPKQESTGYDYGDDRILSFSLTHLSGTGCPNSGEVQLMPTVGRDNARTTVRFRHSEEQAHPGFYAVRLENKVGVELSVTARSGIARFTYPSSEFSNLVLDTRRTLTGVSRGDSKIVNTRQVSGWVEGGNFCGTGNRYRVYYWLESDRDFATHELGEGRTLLTYDTRIDAKVQVRVGISYVSAENAHANLVVENPAFDFEATRRNAAKTWLETLGKIRVRGGSRSQTRLFYTTLYRSLLHPNVYSDVNGEYLGFDNRVHEARDRVHYANFSGWDIYRSQVQLIAWLFPERASDIAQSLVADAEQCGAFPKWAQNNTETGVMVGDPGAAIVANLFAFGAQHFDRESALEIMKRTGTVPEVACQGRIVRPGLKDYRSLGYTSNQAYGVAGGAATTLEYVYADAAIARFSEAMGDLQAMSRFETQAASWLSLWDPETRAIRPRLKNGQWASSTFDLSSHEGFVEGTGAQYVWMVPHDPRTLIERMGGDAEAVRRLDDHLSKVNDGQHSTHFYIGNEPSFGTPWLYLWAHAPSKTQDAVRRVLEESYGDRPGGLPGNDDMGATSSWYVWGALGLYPALPGVMGLAVSSPLFPQVEITLPNGRALKLEGAGAPARYVQSALLNGKPWTRTWLEESFLRTGGTLRFRLGATPSAWGTGRADAPPSFSPREFASLAAAANNSGISTDSDERARGDFNGYGDAFSREALAAQGLLFQPGFDNVIAAGQRIRFDRPKTGTSEIRFVGASSGGTATGLMKLFYRDGSMTEVELSLGEWTLESGAAKVPSGNRIVAEMPYFNRPNAEAKPIKSYLFEGSVPLDPSRELVAIELPSRVSRGRMHFFRLELGARLR